MDKKFIAHSLGLPTDASDNQITEGITKLQKDKKDAVDRATKAEAELNQIKDAKAKNLAKEANQNESKDSDVDEQKNKKIKTNK